MRLHPDGRVALPTTAVGIISERNRLARFGIKVVELDEGEEIPHVDWAVLGRHAVEQALRNCVQADARLRSSVLLARRYGVTWDQLAGIVHLSRQALLKRYGADDRAQAKHLGTRAIAGVGTTLYVEAATVPPARANAIEAESRIVSGGGSDDS